MVTDPAPDVVIIGAIKCATTTLHHQLAGHLQISAAHPKELNFFSHDTIHERGLTWYRDQFEDRVSGQCRLESSPNYTKRQHWPNAAQRLADANPAALLIYLVREPISRMHSAYIHELAAGRGRGSPEAMLADHSNPITQTTRYAWQLEPYLDLFGRDQIFIIRFDELVRDPLESLNRTLAFLELATVSQVDVDSNVQNSSRAKTMPTRLARTLRIPQARGALRRVHPRLADQAIPKVTISSALENSIRDYLRPDLEQLQSTGLVDVSDWIALHA